MKKAKKLLSLALSMILVLSAFIAVPVSFSAQEDELITGTFTLDTFDGYDPGELDYYYSDSYFSHSGKEEDPHLRTMSAVLAFSIDGTSDTPVETYGKLLTDIGFGDVAAYDMDHTAMDSMGVVFAHKMIGDIEVVAVALRGDAYGVEMAANLIADAEGDIRAFADAEALVQSRLTDYLTQYGITSAKYWVVGYSRAGALIILE